MTVRHFVWAAGFLLVLNVSAHATVDDSTTTTTTTLEAPEPQQTTLSDEAETKGVIPSDADTVVSTQPITPTSIFPEKNPYDQARDELIRALDLMNKGHYEAASDTALEAYDDLVDLHKVPGVKRSVIRGQIKQAAEVYVEAGIAYIKTYVHRMGSTPEAIEEGRSRMEDLRDVARNYPELTKKLNSAIVALSSGTVGPAK